MKPQDEDLHKLEQALRMAHDKQPPPEVKKTWKLDVMREIRRLGPLPAESGNGVYLNRLVWRFSLATMTIALLLAIYALSTGFMPDYDVANIIMNDLEGVLSYQPLEIL